ncbi:MAG: aminotransferase class I/II-fold pyridoxal phosphate-dependent enzyme [Clostridiales bacterium]|nr:aminotransferase class I/II-fold pyridoxal phosphate-dependent enzyme [Clostridiales bacterium]
MRKYINSKLEGLAPSGIRRFFDIASEMDHVISLGVGEPDFDTPWKIREAGIYSIEQGRTIYTANAGLKRLREEIGIYVKRKYNLEYDPQHEILVTVGGSEAIDVGLRAILEPGDEVLIPEPCFVCYAPCTLMAGGVPVPVPLSEKNEFKLTPEDILSHVTERTKVLIFPFPNNPTGAVMERRDLEKVRQLIIDLDLFVISDEIYAELTYGDERHVSIGSLPGMRERTLVINGFSKTFSMTGWRLGYAVGPEDLITQMVKLHQYAIMCAPTLSQYAAIEALTGADQEVEEMRTEYNHRRRLVLKLLKDMGVPCFEPKGAFYVFPNISQFGLTSEEFCEQLLYKKHVAVVPGSAFGASGEGFVRISYAYSMQQLKTALSLMREFTEELSGR